jgi:hypothetical protein
LFSTKARVRRRVRIPGGSVIRRRPAAARRIAAVTTEAVELGLKLVEVVKIVV